jgi:hypothetical protein
MSILSLFQWYDRTGLAAWMHKSSWGFAVVEMFHLVALALFGGAILIVNLRLLGVFLPDRPAAQMARDLFPLILGTLAVLTVTGVLMISEEAMKCYRNAAFRWKMALFLPALLVSLAVHRKVAASESFSSPWMGKFAALTTLALWLGVGVAGRAVGYL